MMQVESSDPARLVERSPGPNPPRSWRAAAPRRWPGSRWRPGRLSRPPGPGARILTRRGRRDRPPRVEVHGGDPQPLLVERRHGLDGQPFYERPLTGQGVRERHRVARGVRRRQQLLGAGLAVGTLHARGLGDRHVLHRPAPRRERTPPAGQVAFPLHVRPTLDGHSPRLPPSASPTLPADRMASLPTAHARKKTSPKSKKRPFAKAF
jgi:hypothetical protein